MMAAVDLEAERERARRRREEQLLETRAFRIMRNPGRFATGKNYPSRWSATREELEKAIEKEWPGDHRVELREEVLAECLELQEQRREDVRHVDPEQWEAEVASDAKQHIEEQLRADPTLSNDELIRRYPGKLPVARSTFYGYASDVRNALGIDGQEMAKARRAADSGAEPEEGKRAEQDPTQRGEGADAPPKPAPPPSPAHEDAEPGPEDYDEAMEALRRAKESAFPLTPALNGGNGRISITRGGRGIVAEKDEDGTWHVTVTTEDAELVDRIAGALYEELFEVEA